LLIRRSISTGELACYLAYVPEHYVCSLTDLVKVAGTRWGAIDGGRSRRRGMMRAWLLLPARYESRSPGTGCPISWATSVTGYGWQLFRCWQFSSPARRRR
jgi:hypothetical protein